MIKLKDMKEGVRYKVVTGGSTLYKGDSIVLSSFNGNIHLCTDDGWISEGWQRLRNQVELDYGYYQDKIQTHKDAISDLEQVIKLLKEDQYG